MNGNDDLEFNVLGFKVKFRPDGGGEEVSSSDIVDHVLRESDKIKVKYPNLDDGQVAVLLSLQLVKSLKTLEKEYLENITKFRSTADDALKLIEEVIPVVV